MGEGLVRATAAAAKGVAHVKLVKQPNPLEVHIKCDHCGVVMVYNLPSSIPDMTKFIKNSEKAHANCAKP